MEQIINYIKPELAVLPVVLYFLGMALKNAQAVKDKNIPITLGAAGIILAALWVVSTSTITGWQSVVLALFTAIVQGGLCALASVGLHQMYKQAKEKKEEP